MEAPSLQRARISFMVNPVTITDTGINGIYCTGPEIAKKISVLRQGTEA
jgi:hypothetical protein